MDFEDQLKKAISRGQEQGSSRKDNEQQQQLSLESLKNRHTEYRLVLSEHIEAGLKRMADHFPGFQYETIYGSRGWGGAIFRDDIKRGSTGRGGSFYSRLEITVRPHNEFNVINITGKGTVQNKEYFNWNMFKDIPDAVVDDFRDSLDAWMLAYAEKFASM